MFTVDEIRNILIARSREHYGQIKWGQMAKGCSDQINTIAAELFDRLNAEIDLAVDDIQYDLCPPEDDE